MYTPNKDFCSFFKGDQRSDDGFVEVFSEQVELAIQAILSAIQSLMERKRGKENAETALMEDGGYNLCHLIFRHVSS